MESQLVYQLFSCQISGGQNKKMMIKNKGKQKGQVVLMVLLASALVLTLGLSASRKATIETKIDTDQELLKKAFNAAESGIEYYLGTGNLKYGDSNSTDGSASLTIGLLGNTQNLSFGNVTLEGTSDYFWLVDHTNNGDIGTVYYSASTSTINICNNLGTAGSFKIDYYYKVGTMVSKSSVTQATNASGCVNNFSLAMGNSLLLVVTPVGTGFAPKIEIQGSSNFPTQGEEISSTGTVDGVNNTVTVINKFYIPSFLLEAITSGGDVTNQ